MRVLTFTSLFPNAAQPLLGIFIYQRVAHLARRPGNTVEVVAPVPYFASWARWSRRHALPRIPRQERIGDLTVHHPRYLLFPKVSMPLHGWLMFLGSLFVVLRLNRRVSFDCLDAHYVYPDGFAATLLGRLLGIPVIVSARGTDINVFPSFRLIQPMIRWTLRRAAGIVAVSLALKEAMVRIGAPAEKIQVISNGVDVGQFYPLDRGEARRHLGLPEAGRIIVSVGGLADHKGFPLLIWAVAELAPRYPALMLYVVGEGDARASLERLIGSLEMQQRVFLVGSRPNEQLRFWYSAAEVSCLASAREGLPNVLLESLACGTPVVATRVGGVAEVITSGDLGVLVEQNASSIAAGLEIALQKPWERDDLVRSARTRTWEVVAEEVENSLVSRLPGSHSA